LARHRAVLSGCGALLLLAAAPAQANAQTSTARRDAEQVHRCAGPPVFYTSDPQLIRRSRCEPLSKFAQRANPGSAQAPGKPGAQSSRGPRAGAAYTVIGERPVQPAAAPAPAPAPVAPPPAVKAAGDRVVSSAQQKERDSDRVAILRNELDSEQRKLAALQERLRAAEQSADPNKSTRIASVQKDISRTESDIQALTREVALATR
jgi:hypothetical protein